MAETLRARLDASVEEAAFRDTDQDQDQDQDKTSANSLRFLSKPRMGSDDTEVIVTSVSTVKLRQDERDGDELDKDKHVLDEVRTEVGIGLDHVPYRLYKRRFVGLVALVRTCCIMWREDNETCSHRRPSALVIGTPELCRRNV